MGNDSYDGFLSKIKINKLILESGDDGDGYDGFLSKKFKNKKIESEQNLDPARPQWK